MTRVNARRILAASLPILALVCPARAVLFYSTSDPSYNTTAPVGSLANAAWQYEGLWSSYLGTAIAPQYFITAAHVGGSVGNTFTLNGVSYQTIPFPDGNPYEQIMDSSGSGNYTDLVIWKISGTFPAFAPLYSSSVDGSESTVATASNPAVIIGRGTQRGTPVLLGSELRGWQWGVDDHAERWGTNVITSANNLLAVGPSTGYTLRFNFDANPADRSGASAAGYSGVNEASLSGDASGGDSGGGVFIKTASGQWKLAGINWAATSGYSTTSGGTALNASLFDTGGFYAGSSQVPDGSTDVPVSAYASQISANLSGINAVIGNSWAWNVDASGTWSSSANWWNATLNTAPNGVGKEVVFGSVITGPRTVTLSDNRTIGSLVLDGANPYTLAGTSTLALNTITGTSVSITVTSGSHTIALPLTLNKAATIAVNKASSILTVTGAFTPAAGTTLKKTGLGSVILPNLRGVDLSISGGSVRIASNGTSTGTSNITSLNVTAGNLDLSDNDLVINYTGTSPASIVQGLLLSGRNGGTWNGTGIISSTAAGDAQHRTALAVVEASDLLGLSGNQTASWSGQTVDATSVLLKYTYYGDANLDGKITADDYALFDRGQAKGLGGWLNGDFNYDGVVNSADLMLIDQSYLQQGGVLSPAQFLAEREAAYGEAYVSQLLISLPEPSLAGCLMLGLAVVSRRRR